MARVISTFHLWITWAEIALEHTKAASEARARGLPFRDDPDQSHLFSAALTIEMKASMVAISAAAHAIDAFYAEVDQLIQVPTTTASAWAKNRTPRWSRILETLKLGCGLGTRAKSLSGRLNWLYDLRDAAVHFKSVPGDLVPHPTGTNTSPEVVTYSLEPAEQAIDLLLDVLRTCEQDPKPQLVAYFSRFDVEVQRLHELRANLTSLPSPAPQP